MFGSHRFENPYDPDDDGRDLEITPEEEAASDDQGRAEAETLLGQMGTRERNENDRNFGRWLLRSAKKALAEGAERRRVARKREKAHAAADAEAARVREENARKAEKSRRACEHYCRESDAIWAGVWEQARRDDAAWEAERPAREAAERAATTRPAKPPIRATRGPTGQRRAEPAVPQARPWAKPVVYNAQPSVQLHAGAVTKGPTWSAAPPPVTRPAHQPRVGNGSGNAGDAAANRLTQPSTLPAYSARATTTPSARAVARTPSASRTNPAMPATAGGHRADTPARAAPMALPPKQSLPPPLPPAAPAPPEPPPFTGADLAAYRTSLGLSQGALAERLGTTQGTVSKAEGNPAALLGPTLRRAMWDAQRAREVLPGEPPPGTFHKEYLCYSGME
jgi:hypothetical protein